MVHTDAVILAAVEKMLKKASGSLLSYWSGIVSIAHSRGYNEVVMILLGKGFTAAQIAAADSLGDWEMSQSLFWAFTMGGGLEGYDRKAIEALDLREWLQKNLTALAINGVFTEPAGSAGLASSGPISTANDIFAFPTEEDLANAGERLRW